MRREAHSSITAFCGGTVRTRRICVLPGHRARCGCRRCWLCSGGSRHALTCSLVSITCFGTIIIAWCRSLRCGRRLWCRSNGDTLTCRLVRIAGLAAIVIARRSGLGCGCSSGRILAHRLVCITRLGAVVIACSSLCGRGCRRNGQRNNQRAEREQ